MTDRAGVEAVAVTEPEQPVDEQSAHPTPAEVVSPESQTPRKRSSDDVVLHLNLAQVRSEHLKGLTVGAAPVQRHIRDLQSLAMEPAVIAMARRQQEQYADIVRMAQGSLHPMLENVNQVARMLESADQLARMVERFRAPLVPLPVLETIEAIKSRFDNVLSPLHRFAELEDLVRMSSVTSTLTAAALGVPELDPGLRHLLTANAASLQETLHLVSPTPVRPDRSIQFAGEAALTVASGGLLLADPQEEEEDTFESLVGDSRAELVARLDEVCPGVSEQLLGAWERLNKPGPAAVSQAADSIVELVDRTLRALASKEEVLRWHIAEGRPKDELHKDGPTRRLRIVYIFRGCGHPDRAAKAADHLVGLCQLAQGEKHAGTGTAGLASLRLTLAGVEGALSLLLGL